MKIEIRNDRSKASGIELGSVISIPKYNTHYIVHVADRCAINQRIMDAGEYFPYKEMKQLYRLDGTKPYRVRPFTNVELRHLVESLDAEVYSPSEYKLELSRK